MKLRIRGNSLRLRLLRAEVEQLKDQGQVTETIRFGPSPAEQLTYALEMKSDAALIDARFAGNKITVRIPVLMARNWIETELIALQSEAPAENADSENDLKILIEKDFVCLERKDDADNIDAFPHPAASKCRQ
jgi:hypothetical protein